MDREASSLHHIQWHSLRRVLVACFATAEYRSILVQASRGNQATSGTSFFHVQMLSMRRTHARSDARQLACEREANMHGTRQAASGSASSPGSVRNHLPAEKRPSRGDEQPKRTTGVTSRWSLASSSDDRIFGARTAARCTGKPRRHSVARVYQAVLHLHYYSAQWPIQLRKDEDD